MLPKIIIYVPGFYGDVEIIPHVVWILGKQREEIREYVSLTPGLSCRAREKKGASYINIGTCVKFLHTTKHFRLLAEGYITGTIMFLMRHVRATLSLLLATMRLCRLLLLK